MTAVILEIINRQNVDIKISTALSCPPRVRPTLFFNTYAAHVQFPGPGKKNQLQHLKHYQRGDM